MSTPLVYSDDPDASCTFTVTDKAGNDLDWAPLVAVKGGDYDITAEWLGDPAPERKVKVPLDSLAAGSHALYLKVPGGNDLRLGFVSVKDRS
jgi:hypothetical protein